MTTKTPDRAEIVDRVIAVCEQLEDEGACSCCIGAALISLGLTVEDVLLSVTPQARAELRKALDNADTSTSTHTH